MVKIVGAKAHAARLKKIQGPEMVKAVGAALHSAGDLIKADAQISITTGAVGGKFHVPSKPGEPPNADSGHLDGAIENVQVAPLRSEVSSNARYSAALEFGTSRMAARPFMQPAATKNRAEVTRIVREAVKQVVDAAGRGNPKG